MFDLKNIKKILIDNIIIESNNFTTIDPKSRFFINIQSCKYLVIKNMKLSNNIYKY